MFIIEGKYNKTKPIINFVMKELINSNILIIDSNGFTQELSDLGYNYLSILDKQTTADIINHFDEHYHIYRSYDWIVLNVDAKKDEIDLLKRLDRSYPQNFIATIHEHSKGITIKYFI